MLAMLNDIHAEYCLVQSTLNNALWPRCPHSIALQPRCTRSILPYAVHALTIALCCACLILLYRHAVHTEYCLMLSMLNIALCWPCSMISTLNIALCSLRLILPYAVHAQYCLTATLSMLNIALQPRCPRSILPYSHAVHAQYCLELSIRLILPYSHTVHAQYCHMLSTLAIALCCPH